MGEDNPRIVSINKTVEVKLEPDQDVVDFLEDLLEQAREGSITEIGCVVSYYDGTDTFSSFAGMMYDPVRFLGEIERLKWQYQCWIDEVEQ